MKCGRNDCQKKGGADMMVAEPPKEEEDADRT